MPCAGDFSRRFLIPENLVTMDFYADKSEMLAGVRRPVPGSADERHMLRAIELAELGRGRTGPNPLVGAVVVAGGRVLGEGYHEVLGGPHAEVNALEQAGAGARGASLYVTLEPCTHYGRTPPCADRVVESGIARLVVAMRDPNPDVDGGGERFLAGRGVEVTDGPYGEIASRQNEVYIKRITTGLPFVTLKMAMSIDGKTATSSGDSRWISSDESRGDVHEMRAASDAVMVGVGTVLSDDPRLTARIGRSGRSPLRVVVDSHARTPPESLVTDTSEAPTIVAVSKSAPAGRVGPLEEKGVRVVEAGGNGRVDLRRLLEELSDREVASVLVEGGSDLACGLWERELVDKLVFYIAPKIIGGRGAPGPIGGTGAERIEDAWPLSIDAVFKSGIDMKVVAYPMRGE